MSGPKAWQRQMGLTSELAPGCVCTKVLCRRCHRPRCGLQEHIFLRRGSGSHPRVCLALGNCSTSLRRGSDHLQQLPGFPRRVGSLLKGPHALGNLVWSVCRACPGVVTEHGVIGKTTAQVAALLLFQPCHGCRLQRKPMTWRGWTSCCSSYPCV